MRFAQPIAVKCPRCAADSRHNLTDLLALTAACPACNVPLDEIGVQIGAKYDEAKAFGVWAEILMCVEDRLGICYPGISDAEFLVNKSFTELTLRDLSRLILGHAPPGVCTDDAANRVVLESAAEVAGHQVLAEEMDRPLLQALRLSHWAEKHRQTGLKAAST